MPSRKVKTSRSHGHYDVDIVAELVLTEQREGIPQYSNFFKQYPDSSPDELSELVDISGVKYEVRVRTYDSFGEDAFRVKFVRRR